MRVFISAGEASGDAYGRALLDEMAKLAQIDAEALGGSKLSAAGARLVVDTSNWGAIGIAQALKIVPRVWAGVRKAKAALREGSPGLFVAIDFGYVNIRLARYAKSFGWKVLYFIPPGSWRRDRQGRDLPEIADEIVTPFPWSAEILRGMGASAHWFGHPIKQLIRAEASIPRSPSTAVSQTEELGHRIAVLPGSRDHEIGRNLPAIAQALRIQEEAVEFAVAPTADADGLRAEWQRLAPQRLGDIFTAGDTYGVLRRARAGIICSGTATLEAALCGCPFVVIYQVSALMALQFRLMGMVGSFISLPNIILGRAAVPELVYRELTPERLSRELAHLLVDSRERESQIRAFAELDEMLGPPSAIVRTAELAIEMLTARTG